MAPEISGLTFIKLLGSGGFADVYLYEQASPARRVAVKVLRDPALGRDGLSRFKAEADAMAQLEHPHIVPVYWVGQTADGLPFFTMMYYPKGSLSSRVKQGPMPVADVLRLAVQLAGALETAHRAGILHRDVKPANVLIDQFGRIGLGDFGIASRLAAADPESSFSVPWCAPEILLGTSSGSVRSDVYGLAATLWHLLVGRSPFEVPGGDNAADAMAARVLGTPPPSTDLDDVPMALDRLLRRGLAKDPAQRPGSVLEFVRSLQAIQETSGSGRTELVLPPEEATSLARVQVEGTTLVPPTARAAAPPAPAPPVSAPPVSPARWVGGDPMGPQTPPRVPAAMPSPGRYPLPAAPQQPTVAPLQQPMAPAPIQQPAPAAAAQLQHFAQTPAHFQPAHPQPSPVPPPPPAPPAQRRRRRRGVALWLGVAAVVIALGVIVAAVVFLRPKDSTGATGGTGTPSNTTSAPPMTRVSLLTADDLVQGQGGTWVEATTRSVTTCLPKPSGQSTSAQTINFTSSWQNGTAFHQVELFPSQELAAEAFVSARASLGGCGVQDLTYLANGWEISNLGEQAVGDSYVLQSATPVHHTVLLIRSGRLLNVLDLGRDRTAVTGEQALKSAWALLNHQTKDAGAGKFPGTTPLIAISQPAAGPTPGELVPADFPQIPGAGGTWSSYPNAKDEVGAKTLCDETAVSKTPNVKIRLNQGWQPPGEHIWLESFALDFPTNAAASNFYSTLRTNFAKCESRYNNVDVTALRQVSVPTVLGTATGGWIKIQFTDGNKGRAVQAVLLAGNRVTYVEGNVNKTGAWPSDAQLDAIFTRIAKRVGEIA